MHKKCIFWLFLLAVFTSNFSGLFVYVSYELNRDYISSNLCVNSDKPWLNCKGQCYLMKKIREAEKDENNRAAKIALNQLSVSFFQNGYTPSFITDQILIDQDKVYSYYRYCYSSQYITRIFRPPKFRA